MKKILALLLTLVLLATALVGCGNTDNSNPPTDSNETSSGVIENNNNSNQNNNSDTNSGNENDTEDDFVPYVPSENAKVVGLGIYVFPTNETPSYSNGAVIKGVETTLNDGTVMYTFGQFQSMYFIGATFDDAYDIWEIDCRYSSNLVYCGNRLAQRTDGTFSSYMEATYVDMTGRTLSYYLGRIYEDNNQYYLVVDNKKEEFRTDWTTIAETVTFYAGDVLVEMEVYFAFDVELFDGLYDSYEFIFYNSSGTVVNTVEFDINNIPSELVWEENYFRADVKYKYHGETLFEKEIRSNSVYLGQDFVCDTVINGIGYHHNISWVVDN